MNPGVAVFNRGFFSYKILTGLDGRSLRRHPAIVT
jgi:hypothetical protein